MDLGLLIIRLTLGLLIAGHGAQKLFGLFGGHGLRGFSAWLGSIGFRPATLWALLGGLSEFGGGLLFAAGFLNPLGSIAIAASMLTAITKAHWPKLWVTDGGFEYPLVHMAVAIAVALTGPGAFSLDALLGVRVPLGIVVIAAAAAAFGYLVGVIHSAQKPAGVPSRQAAAQ